MYAYTHTAGWKRGERRSAVECIIGTYTYVINVLWQFSRVEIPIARRTQ